MSKVAYMAGRGKTVEVDLELYESITRIVEESTGFKPKIKDFVNKAIQEKLARYQSSAGKREKRLKKTG